MKPPMIGSWRVEVRAVRPVQIHSDQYYDLFVMPLGMEGAQLTGIRAAEDVFEVDPQEGQTLEITFLMGQVTGARVVG